MRYFRKFYRVGENKISYVHMAEKHNYNHSKTISEVKKLMKDYQMTGSGKSHVIHVSDKDLNAADPRDARFVLDLRRYCKDNTYALVWFVKTIEDVLWGHTINSKQKKRKVLQFISQNQIDRVEKTNLFGRSNVNAEHKSNVLTVLNRFETIRK